MPVNSIKTGPEFFARYNTAGKAMDDAANRHLAFLRQFPREETLSESTVSLVLGLVDDLSDALATTPPTPASAATARELAATICRILHDSPALPTTSAQVRQFADAYRGVISQAQIAVECADDVYAALELRHDAVVESWLPDSI